jgi:ABC-type Fe3+ transport system substrate-binding protein
MLRIAQVISAVYLVLVLVLAGLSFRPAPGPVQISMVYGTEKEGWLLAAAEQFAASNPTTSSGSPIEIELEGVGSRETVLRIVGGDLRPTVISPASSIQVELLRDEWATRNNGEQILHEGNDAPQPLVITPLVVVAWEERAEALNLDDPDQLWENLHQVLASDEGWQAFDHTEWGFANLGHTSPETSNSGIQSLVLMTYAYHDKTRDLSSEDILDQGFQEWLSEIERSVPEFPSSTGFLMDNMLRFGPSQYDFVIVYENLAIENFRIAEGRGGPIQVYYPPANILSDHPYAILNAEWVTPEQREAAALFRSFLLSEEIQQQALVEYGFRPANTAVALNVEGNPFTRYAEQGVQLDIAQSVEVPSAQVLNELLDLWRRGDYE